MEPNFDRALQEAGDHIATNARRTGRLEERVDIVAYFAARMADTRVSPPVSVILREILDGKHVRAAS